MVERLLNLSWLCMGCGGIFLSDEVVGRKLNLFFNFTTVAA
jgi:hypothetical protein